MALQFLSSNWSCTSRCRSKQHADFLSNALSKAPSEQARTYFLCSCRNFWRLTDNGGRNLVHWAASMGKTDVLEWLISEFRADISSKDTENGYTPLHRSLIHGQISCAQVLLDSGASINALDHEGVTVLDLIHKDQNTGGLSLRDPVELYSCGENMSYNLGHAHPTPRILPEPVDFFRTHRIFIRKVSMSKFHSLFLSQSGQVYACGHGLGGRLGLGNEEPQFRPTLVSALRDTVVDVAAATDHSIFVDQAGNAYSFGTNMFRQLGLDTTEDKFLKPELIRMPKVFKGKFIGCAAGSCHSVLWSDDWCLYTFGLNAGQIGHNKSDGDFITQPKKVPAFGLLAGSASEQEKRIFVDVCSTDGAIVVATGFESDDSASKTTKKGGETWIFYKFGRIRIASKQLETKSVHAVGGHLEKVSNELKETSIVDPLRVLILTNSGKVFHWHEDDQVLRRCLFSGSRQIYPHDIALNRKGLVAVCEDGRAFRGSFGMLKKGQISSNNVVSAEPLKQSSKEKRSKQVSSITWRSRNLDGQFLSFLDQNECQGVSLNKLPAAHRAIAAFNDSTGKNLMLIQQSPSRDLTEIPLVRPGEISEEMKKILSDADVGDFVHDLEIVMANRRYPVHRFVVQARAPGLVEAIRESLGDGIVISEQWPLPPFCCGLNPNIFQELLNFVYTDDCALLRMGTRWGESGVMVKLPMREQNQGSNEQKQKKGKKNKQKLGNEMKTKEAHGGKNPLKQLQDLAKKLGVKSLAKKLDCVQWEPNTDGADWSGTVKEVKHKTVGIPKLKFDLNSHVGSCDVKLMCRDKVELKAHRCLLVARVEYFRCMLGSEWMEVSQQRGTAAEPTQLTMPFDSDVVRALLYYIYTDEIPASAKLRLETEQTPDLLCKLLVSADQLLMERMKELCEASIAETISLRNAADLLQFSETYNASELKNACLQFVCLNLAAFVDCNGLQGLERECLDAIGTYYRRMYSQVGNRILTPSSGDPSIERIQTLYSELVSAGLSVEELTACYHEEHQIEATGLTHGTVTLKSATDKKKPATPQYLNQKQRKSSTEKKISLMAPLKIEQFPLPLSPSPSSPNSESVDLELRNSVAVHCVTGNSGNPWNNGILTPTSPESSFLKIVEEEERADSGNKNKRSDGLESYFTRKRREAADKNQTGLMAWCETPDSPPTDKNSLISLVDVMAEESKEQKRRSQQNPLPLPMPKLVDKKNPWGSLIQPLPVDVKTGGDKKHLIEKKLDGSGNQKSSFKAILEEEEGRLAEKAKQERKPLSAIQLEEQAMDELLVAYGAEKNFDISISVERVTEVKIAEPIWQAHV